MTNKTIQVETSENDSLDSEIQLLNTKGNDRRWVRVALSVVSMPKYRNLNVSLIRPETGST